MAEGAAGMAEGAARMAEGAAGMTEGDLREWQRGAFAVHPSPTVPASAFY